MGVVYAAYDPQLDRKVAIKLLRRARCRTPPDSGVLREAQAIARLSHPNVVAIYEVGKVEDGRSSSRWSSSMASTLRRWAARSPGPARSLGLYHAGRAWASPLPTVRASCIATSSRTTR